jgi:hypothetical protein
MKAHKWKPSRENTRIISRVILVGDPPGDAPLDECVADAIHRATPEPLSPRELRAAERLSRFKSDGDTGSGSGALADADDWDLESDSSSSDDESDSEAWRREEWYCAILAAMVYCRIYSKKLRLCRPARWNSAEEIFCRMAGIKSTRINDRWVVFIQFVHNAMHPGPKTDIKLHNVCATYR